MRIGFWVVCLRFVALIVFGVVLPGFMFWSAYYGMSSLAEVVKIIDIVKYTNESRRWTDDQYTLFSAMFLENVNFSVISNKQLVKFSVMKIGFAISSIGIMLLMFGFDRRREAEVSGGGINLKVESFGALVFVIGALVAAFAGVSANEYKTMGLPNFSSAKSYIHKEEVFKIVDGCIKAKKPTAECVRVGILSR